MALTLTGLWCSGAGPLLAETVFIGDTSNETNNVPPNSLSSTLDTLILGNTDTGNGTLNFSAGTLDISHAGGYSGYVTVGNSGTGAINHDNSNGDASVDINGPFYHGPQPDVAPDPWGGYLFLGRNNGSSGSYTMTDTSSGNALALNVLNEIQIGGSNVSTQAGGGFSCNGGNCTGSFLQNGGDVTAGQVTIGIGTGTGSYTINSGTLTSFLDLGNTSQGANTFTQNGGTVNAGMFIANGGGSNGTYTLNDGTLNSGSSSLIGLQGTGTFTQTGGTHNAGNVSLGSQSTGTGTYNLSGGTFNVGTGESGSLLVGDTGQGVFNMTGGTLSINNNNININAFVVGNKAGSVGTFTQSGGVVDGGRSLHIGAAGGTGTYNLNTDQVNGTIPKLNTGFFSLGFSGTGVFNQQAGTTNNTGALFIGASDGTYNQFGGDLIDNNTVVGTFGTGKFNQSGGTHTTDALSLGQHAGSSGTYQLSDGALIVGGQMIVGQGDTDFSPGLNGLVKQSGGTVTANQILIGGFVDFFSQGNPISNFGTGRYELSGGTVTSFLDTQVGATSQGSVLQTGGTFNAGNLTLGSSGLFSQPDGSGGNNFYSSGIYNLQGGSLNTTGTTVAMFGLGRFNQSGTSQHNVTGNLVVGAGPGLIDGSGSGQVREGIYTLSGGNLSVTGDTIIGAGNNDFLGEPGGKGTFTQSGGTHSVDGNLILGEGGSQGNGNGTYNLSGEVNTVLHVTGDEVVGGKGTGTFTQSGGTHTVDGQMTIGQNGGSTGTYSLQGGTLNDSLIVGDAGTGTFTNSAGTHNVTGDLTLGNQSTGKGTYNLSGTGSLTVTENTVVGADGTGLFNQTGGTNNVTGSVTVGSKGTFNVAGGALSAASLTNNGTLNYSAGSLTLGGGSGTLTNNIGATLNNTGTLSNSGTLKNYGTLNNDGTLNNTGILNNDGSMTGNGTLNNSGLLAGHGTINGTVANSGTVNPGNSPGKLSIIGSFSQGASGTFHAELGGTLQGSEYDWLAITGTASLAGILDIYLYGNFLPSFDDTFTILTAGNITGSFDSYSYHYADGSFGLNSDWRIIYDQDSVTLKFISGGTGSPIPEPDTLLLVGIGMAGFAGLRLKRKKR